MRQKTEIKRQKILNIAGDLFRDQGFDAVSMSEISKQVGGSKATLYNYFTSKEEIFVEVMLGSAQMLCSNVFEVLDHDLPLREKLIRSGTEYLTFILSKEMVAIRRMVLQQAAKTDIGKQVFERGIKKGWMHLATLLDEMVKAGQLKPMDSWRAAMQFRGLLDAELVDRRMLGVDDHSSRKMIKANVIAAVDMFLTYYAVPKSGKR